jgi:hypothetical protein
VWQRFSCSLHVAEADVAHPESAGGPSSSLPRSLSLPLETRKTPVAASIPAPMLCRPATGDAEPPRPSRGQTVMWVAQAGGDGTHQASERYGATTDCRRWTVQHGDMRHIIDIATDMLSPT